MIWIQRRRAKPFRRKRKLLFAVALGLCDGILNALTLASATVLTGVGLHFELAGRVGVVALATAIFAVFVAEYAQYRGELAEAERQLMFTRSGRLASSSLGRAVIRDAVAASAAAGVSSFVGASLPLVVGALLPTASWLAIVASVAALGGLGILLAANVGGRPAVWAGALVIAGIAMTLLGVRVNLV